MRGEHDTDGRSFEKTTGQARPRRLRLTKSDTRQLVQHGNREPHTPPAPSQPMHVPPPSCPHCGSTMAFLRLGSFVQEHAH